MEGEGSIFPGVSSDFGNVFPLCGGEKGVSCLGWVGWRCPTQLSLASATEVRDHEIILTTRTENVHICVYLTRKIMVIS